MLKQHANAAGRAFAAHAGSGLAQHRDAAARWMLQAQNLAQQHGLATARAAHNRQQLAGFDAQTQVPMHHRVHPGVVKHRPEFVNLNHWCAHMPTFLKTTANSASTSSTTVMLVTTEAVVP